MFESRWSYLVVEDGQNLLLPENERDNLGSKLVDKAGR
jgi:hypothetical protein